MAEKKSAHTPGPWMVAEDDENGQAIVRGEHTEIATCWHHCVGSIERQMRANARLIAAAPTMLEALKEFSREYDGFEDGDGNPCPTLAKARAAITRAEAQ